MGTASTCTVPTSGMSKPKLVQDLVGGLARDVGQHHVADRLQRRVAQDRQAAHGRVVGEDLQDLVGELRGGRDAQVQHRLSLSHPGPRIRSRRGTRRGVSEPG